MVAARFLHAMPPDLTYLAVLSCAESSARWMDCRSVLVSARSGNSGTYVLVLIRSAVPVLGAMVTPDGAGCVEVYADGGTCWYPTFTMAWCMSASASRPSNGCSASVAVLWPR